MVNTVEWSKRPTYEQILRDIDKDYKVKLPDRTAVHFYDSFAMSEFRNMQQEIEGSKIQADTNRDEAMTQAAAEEGVSRQELVQFANHLNQQSTATNAELRQSLERTADSHRQTIQQQTDAFARQLGEERARQDERARITDENIRRLAESNRIPAAPTPAPNNTNEITQAVRDLAQEIYGQNSQHMRDQMNAFTGNAHQLTAEIARGMTGHNEEMRVHMKAILEAINRPKRDEEPVIMMSDGGPPPPPPGAGAIRMDVDRRQAQASSSSSSGPPPPGPPPAASAIARALTGDSIFNFNDIMRRRVEGALKSIKRPPKSLDKEQQAARANMVQRRRPMLAIEEQAIAAQSPPPPPPPPPGAGAIASSSSSSSGPQIFNIAHDDDDLQLADGRVNPTKLAKMIKGKKNDRIVQGTVITKRAPTPKTVQGKAIRKKTDY